MKVHLVDGTYELFRAFFSWPSSQGAGGREVGACRGLLRSLRSLLREPEVTHVACAFDHCIESFRNDLFQGYKTGTGIDEALLSQFELAEQVCHALGVAVWSMVEFEADDALATGAERFSAAPEVTQVVICSPDKDLAQCVIQERVVCLDRMRKRVLDEAGVIEKFGVRPASIPDYLALVGDAADGIPGVPRWGKKSAAAVLASYGHLECIPANERDWSLPVRGAAALASQLQTHRDAALLYRRLATLRRDVPLTEDLSALQYRGAARDAWEAVCLELDDAEARTLVSFRE